MRAIKFRYQYGWGEQNCTTEIFEYADDVTKEEIEEDCENWVWNQIGDKFWWEEIE